MDKKLRYWQAEVSSIPREEMEVIKLDSKQEQDRFIVDGSSWVEDEQI